MKQELPRQTIHVFFFLFAFLLTTITRWQMILILTALLAFSLIVIPHTGIKKYFYRQQDKKYSKGAISYFGSLIFLVLIFPTYAVAAGWSALALGDGLATVAGKRFGWQPLPWNKKKTWQGTAAFFLATFLGCLVAVWWLHPLFNLSRIFTLALMAGVSGSLVESLPLKINDNISVPLITALVVSLI